MEIMRSIFWCPTKTSSGEKIDASLIEHKLH